MLRVNPRTPLTASLARTGSGTSYPGAIADDDAIVVGVMVKGITDGTSETINVILEDTGVLGTPVPLAFTVGSALVPVSRSGSVRLLGPARTLGDVDSGRSDSYSIC